MKKNFFDRKGKSIIAILMSLVLVAVMFVALPGVNSWAAAKTFVTNEDAETNVAVWDSVTKGQSYSGTISAGDTFIVQTASGWDVSGIENYATLVKNGGGEAVYMWNKNVSFQCSGKKISFLAAAGGAVAKEEENKPKEEDTTPQYTAAQIAWAQYHDHAHNSNDAGFGFIVTTPVSEYSDGVEAWGCPECGYIEYRSPISAYDFFNGITTSRFNAAKPGQTITIEAGQWVSFHKSVIDALRKNREITTNIIYKSNGKLSTLTIPRGTDFSNVPEDKYMGIDYLAYCLGIVPVPKFG